MGHCWTGYFQWTHVYLRNNEYVRELKFSLSGCGNFVLRPGNVSLDDRNSCLCNHSTEDSSSCTIR